jgi:hypothetical protein
MEKKCSCCGKQHTNLKKEDMIYWEDAKGWMFNCECGSTLLIIPEGGDNEGI